MVHGLSGPAEKGTEKVSQRRKSKGNGKPVHGSTPLNKQPPAWTRKSYAQEWEEKTQSVQQNGLEVPMWQARLRVARAHKSKLAQGHDRWWLETTTCSSRVIAEYGPSAPCVGRYHAPGVECSQCILWHKIDKSHWREAEYIEAYSRLLVDLENDVKLTKTTFAQQGPSQEKFSQYQSQLQDCNKKLQKLRERKGKGPTAEHRQRWKAWSEKPTEDEDTTNVPGKHFVPGNPKTQVGY